MRTDLSSHVCQHTFYLDVLYLVSMYKIPQLVCLVDTSSEPSQNLDTVLYHSRFPHSSHQTRSGWLPHVQSVTDVWHTYIRLCGNEISQFNFNYIERRIYKLQIWCVPFETVRSYGQFIYALYSDPCFDFWVMRTKSNNKLHTSLNTSF